MELPTTIIPVTLSDGSIVKVEATTTGEERVSLTGRSFREIADSVQSITKEIAETLRAINHEVQPDKLSVKIGLEIAIESGQLTTLLVKGAGKANLEITMEWGK